MFPSPSDFLALNLEFEIELKRSLIGFVIEPLSNADLDLDHDITVSYPSDFDTTDVKTTEADHSS